MVNDPKDSNLLQKMSSEITPEVSPLLRVLLANARLIALVLALCVLGTAGYGGYRWYAEKKLNEAQAELGRILIMAAPADRAAKLKAFLPSAPEGLHTAAYLALAQAAIDAQDYPTAVDAWDMVGKDTKSSLYATAMIGKADALALQDKGTEALAVLEKLQPVAGQGTKMLVESLIVDLAEKTGDYAKALTACDNLTSTSTNPMEADFWRQKAASLRLRQAETKKPS